MRPLLVKIYKRVTFDGEVELVVYSDPAIQDERLFNDHSKNYGEIPFHVEETIAERVLKTTAFSDFTIKGIRVFIYDEIWRTKYEQWYDHEFRLIEYRELFYKNSDDTAFEEKIFFAKSWTCSNEKYEE